MKADTILFLSILGLLFLLPRLVHGQSIPPGGNYVTAADFPLDKLLAPPPGNYSTQTANEIQEILQMQKRKTPDQIAALKEQDTLAPYLLCGTALAASDAPSPLAIDLLLKVAGDVREVAMQGRVIWDRPRPARLDKRIEKLVDLPPDSSYPGVNPTVVYAWAAVLSNLVPERKEAIAAKAEEIALNRVLAGAQYPSDLAAAKTVGEAVAQKLLDNDRFRRDLKGVREELAARMAVVEPAPPSPAASATLAAGAP